MGKRSAVKETSSRSRTPLIVGIIVVGVLALVIGSTLFSRGDDADASGGSSTVGPIPITRAAVQFPASVVDGVVVAGSTAKPAKGKAAPHVLDLYEDAQCPACQALESRGGARLAQAVANGTLKIRYHLLNMLDQRSQPAGYSTLGGNAMMCGAENGIFPDLHVSLYTAQPDEGGTGWTVDQVVDLGKRLGARPGFEACVRNGAHAKEVAANFAAASHDPKLVRQGQNGFGTPTMVLDGTLLQPGDMRLDKLVPASS
ncbi:thioredoxin domain-containing protein [Actinomycetospora sp. TBRC 11914]|uniref:DsbA family protein n=1 Tax=Actinomycetospora sp. TBRC 11914 TaxID=2729387 RepID=UPI00145E3A21|nr:thioredoxin domain-containing protein [Actinomycetospora sp. TBRC 11914]NMO92653.1 thioredoxin domain-containing protein [Actinomycetospora sp. TBRC 11914]